VRKHSIRKRRRRRGRKGRRSRSRKKTGRKRISALSKERYAVCFERINKVYLPF
tara:strand:+ start:624 stop:785 length:162 start_codon:yes stop_codon:yes gene_type:complete